MPGTAGGPPVVTVNPARIGPLPLGGSRESDVRKALFQKNATGKLQLTDPDGTWIDVTDE